MPKGHRPYLPEQDLLLPPSFREWLPEGHLACYVSDIADQLDLSAIHAVSERELGKQPPYDPRMMMKVLVYGYCVGVCSSRRIQKRLQEDIGFKVLAAGNEPDFRTISDFRKIHLGLLGHKLRAPQKGRHGSFRISRSAKPRLRLAIESASHRCQPGAAAPRLRVRHRPGCLELKLSCAGRGRNSAPLRHQEPSAVMHSVA